MASASEDDGSGAFIASDPKCNGRGRETYRALRREYEPVCINLVVIAESPPASGKYFYDPDGAISEPLFKAFMQQLRCRPLTKEEGLRELQRTGWILVDATYQPVDGLSSSRERDKIIARNYSFLCRDLEGVLPDRTTPLVLIKENVCRNLEPKLLADSFNVLNRGRVVPFPSHGWQNRFQHEFRAILMGAGHSVA